MRGREGGGRREEKFGGSLDLLSASSRRIPSASRLDGSRPLGPSTVVPGNSSTRLLALAPRGTGPCRTLVTRPWQTEPAPRRAPRPPSVLTCPSEAAAHGSAAPRASAGPGRARHRRGSAGAMPFPGPGARRRGFPARRGEPAPFYARRPETSPSARLGPPPPCPTPGRRGAGPGAGTLAAPLCAQPSSRLFMAPRPEWARLVHAAGTTGRGQAHTALGRRAAGPRRTPGTRGRGRGPERGANCCSKSAPGAPFPAELERVSFFPRRREGTGFALLRAGRSVLWPRLRTLGLARAGCARRHPTAPPTRRGRRGCHVSPAATPSRLCCGSWPPASLPLPGSSCQKGGMLSSLLESPRGAGPVPAFWGARWYLLGQVRTACGQGEITEVGEDPASPTQKGKGEKEVSWFPGGIRSGEGDQGVR